MTTKEALQKAKSLIDTPEKWMQGHWAGFRDRDDHTSIISREDTISLALKNKLCFCAWGSLVFLSDYSEEINYQEFQNAKYVLNQKVSEKDCSGIIDFNDKPGRTHKEIMDLFDEAINECN